MERGIKRQEMNVSFTRALKIRLNQKVENINQKFDENVHYIHDKIDQKMDSARGWIGKQKENSNSLGMKAKNRILFGKEKEGSQEGH